MGDNKEGGAKHFDGDKQRLDLIPPVLMDEVAKVLGMGAAKYGDYNWRSGIKWSRCIGSLKRHLNKFEKGIDYDEESGHLHLSHLIVNAMFILQYYKDHPELDDRQHKYLKPKRIALDIDDVIADFVGHLKTKFKIEKDVHHWNDPLMMEFIPQIINDEDFWMSIPPLINPRDLHFEPVAYVTSRRIDPSITQKWLDKNGFPSAPLHSVSGKSKLDVCKELNVDIFVEDRFEYFQELNKGGICTYLFDAAHNRKYDVGYKRIKSLKELA